MSSRDARKSAAEGGRGERTSVVGSRMSDATGGLWGNRLPRGGIRETDGLKVADGALTDTGRIRSSGPEERWRTVLRVTAIVSGSLAGLLVVLAVGAAILSQTSAFTIANVQSYDTEHVTAQTVAQLAAIPEGTTLLTVDEQQVEDNVRKNPWVASVVCERSFPDTLRLIVTERTPSALVSLGTGGLGWLLGKDGVWIEPVRIEVAADESTSDAALREAEGRGLLLIVDVPQTVSPVAGCLATDAAIEAVWTYREQLSKAFLDEVVAFSAASENDISCILRAGVEVSFGSTSNIDTKERVATEVLEAYTGQVTYINVRVPTRPTYRRVNSEYVRPGSGATGTILDTESDGTPEDDQVPEGNDTQPDAGVAEVAGVAEGVEQGVDAEGAYDEDGYSSEGYAGDEYGYDTSDLGYDYDDGYYGYDTSDYGYDESDYSEYGYDESYEYYDDSYGYDESYGY